MNKKVITGIIAVVAAVALFVAGYFVSGIIFPKETDTDATPETTLQQETTAEDTTDAAEENDGEEEKKESEYLYLLEDEKLGSGELKISRAEYEYYCISIYNTLISNSFQYDYYYGEGAGLMYTGYDWKKLPSEQECSLEIEGKTFKNYEEYIEYVVTMQLLTTKSCVEYAKLNSITFDDEELKEIESFMEENRKTVADQGMELEEFLKEYYGEEMTEELYINIVKEQYLVNKVDGVKSEVLDCYYTAEMVEKEYSDNLKRYGQVSLRNYIIVADKDDSGAVYKASMDAAKSEAEVFAGLVSDEKSFKQRVSEKEKRNGNEDYAKIIIEDSYTLLKNIGFEDLDAETDDDGLAEWAFDSSRKPGDVYIAKIDDVGYGVYMMVNPLHKPATIYSYDVRHILLKFPEEASVTTEKVKLLNPADYSVTVDIDIYPDITADPALYMEAQGILEQYLAGDCSEESFSELAKQHSADGNAAQGGIYEDVQEGYMVSAFENWALEEGRKKGDVGIVETEFGYHIMYFVGRKVVTDWVDTVKEEMMVNGINTFIKELSGRYTLTYEDKKDGELEKLYQESIDYYSSMLTVQQ